ARYYQQMGDDVVDIQSLDEHLRALTELLLPALRLFGFGHDVDRPAGELTRQPHVLATAPDREAELLVRDDDLDPVVVLVDNHLDHFRRRQRVDDERRRVLGPGYDVDLLALELAYHRLNPAAPHADAGADRVDTGIVGHDGDLRPAAGVAGHRLNLDDAVVDLRHLLGEQLRQELGARAREEDLRSPGLLTHLRDVGAHPL